MGQDSHAVLPKYLESDSSDRLPAVKQEGAIDGARCEISPYSNSNKRAAQKKSAVNIDDPPIVHVGRILTEIGKHRGLDPLADRIAKIICSAYLGRWQALRPCKSMLSLGLCYELSQPAVRQTHFSDPGLTSGLAPFANIQWTGAIVSHRIPMHIAFRQKSVAEKIVDGSPANLTSPGDGPFIGSQMRTHCVR